MSWRPPSSPAGSFDRRLDPYRNRAAVLLDNEGIFATIYVQMEQRWQQVSGHLWWRRWGDPAEVIFGLMNLDREGDYTDWVVGPDEFDGELSDWERGEFQYVGRAYRLEWLDDEATKKVRQHMGVE